MDELITALRKSFANGDQAPVRQSYELPGNATMLLMPAWRKCGSAGIKIVTVHRDRTPAVRATYLLMGFGDHMVKAVLDGTMLTARRTAAASALAADMLAKPDARCLLMLGTGTLAPHLIEAHRSVRPINRVLIWGRDAAKARNLAVEIAGAGTETTVVTDHLSALGDADIISAATLSESPLILGKLVRAGTHIDLVGSFKPGMCEADPESFSRARVFVDTFEGALSEAGDLILAIAAGALSKSDIEADLAQLCSAKHGGRRGDLNAITLFKSVGASIEDLAAAELVFGRWSNLQRV